MTSAQTGTIMRDLQGYFTPAQAKAIINNTENERDKVLCQMLWFTGRRISEVLPLRKKDINFYESLILFKILKKRKKHQRWLPIPKALNHLLKQYTTNLKDDDFLFKSPYVEDKHLSRQQGYRIVNRASKAAGIYKIGEKEPHPHHFRHSFAINLIKHKVPLGVVQKLLAHGDLSTTSVYLQFSQDDLKKSLEQIYG